MSNHHVKMVDSQSLEAVVAVGWILAAGIFELWVNHTTGVRKLKDGRKLCIRWFGCFSEPLKPEKSRWHC